VWGHNIDEEPFDASESLKPFIAIYNESDHIEHTVASSANIHDDPPLPPQGVFDYAKARGENRVTWQPDSTTRIALVVKYVSKESSSWFVVAGRNIREVEARETQLNHIVGAGLAIVLLVTLIAEIIGDSVRRRMMK
jgi:hypothetical protein